MNNNKRNRTIGMSTLVLAFVLASIILSGCASNPSNLESQNKACSILVNKASENLNSYSLYIDSGGQLKNIKNNKVGNTDVYLDNIYSNYSYLKKLDNRLSLTVFIHGGLNTSEDVSERVNNLWKPMLEDCNYPVFISWRSGFPGNYLDHLAFLRRGEYLSTQDFSSFVKGPLVSPFVFIEDTLRAIARTPAATYRILIEESPIKKNLVNDNESIKEIEGIAYHRDATDQGLKFADVWSIANPIKLVIAPYVDSLGTGAWNSMLRRTEMVLAKNEQFNNGSYVPSAVSSFFDKLKNTNHASGITLIGHSMGTIIANNILNKYPNINFTSIVYMAAACSLSDIEKIVVPYLSNNRDTNFYNLSLSPTRDEYENYLSADFLPRGSLLYWIDNIFADINSFEDRTAGYWTNIEKKSERVFPEKIRSQIHLTKFGVNDGSPQNHGDFDDFPFWDKNFWIGKLRL